MTDRPPDIVAHSTNLEATLAIGAAIERCCRPGDLIALQGELGAGKTQLVRGIAVGMGIRAGAVSSPTFVLMQEHESEAMDKPTLVHIDAYRIKSEDDLVSIGWHGHGEELRDGAVVAVEWASLIRPALGDDYLWAELTHEPDGRSIALTAYGNWRDRMEHLRSELHKAGYVPSESS